jgi:hypothetical protein
VRSTEAAALAVVEPFWPAPVHVDSWLYDELESYDHRPNVNTGVLFMDIRGLLGLSFVPRYDRVYMEFLKVSASEREQGWGFIDHGHKLLWGQA